MFLPARLLDSRPFAFLLFVLVTLVPVWFVSGLPGGPVVALAAGVAALEFAVRRLHRSGEGLVGPLFGCDLVRFARRGRTVWLRFAYGLALLVGLAFLYADRVPRRGGSWLTFDPGERVSPKAMAQFAIHATAILAGALFYAVLAVALWLLANWLFRRLAAR